MKATATLIGAIAAMLDPTPPTMTGSGSGIPRRGPLTCIRYSHSPAAWTSTSRPSSPHSHSRTSTGERKASTAGGECSNGGCTDAPASTSSATASSSEETTERHHRNGDGVHNAIAAGLPGPFTGTLNIDGYADYQHLMERLPGTQQCWAHVIRRCRAVSKLGPGSLQPWAVHVIAILSEAHQAVEAARARGDTAVDPELLAGLRKCYDQATRTGIVNNRLCDWDTGNHPG
jgi:Transposase IS66 family